MGDVRPLRGDRGLQHDARHRLAIVRFVYFCNHISILPRQYRWKAPIPAHTSERASKRECHALCIGTRTRTTNTPMRDLFTIKSKMRSQSLAPKLVLDSVRFNSRVGDNLSVSVDERLAVPR